MFYKFVQIYRFTTALKVTSWKWFGQCHVFCAVEFVNVYHQAKQFNKLRSGNDVGQLLGVNESGKLSSNHLWVRLILCDCAVSCWKQK
jgi:hypothetical protein